VSQHLTYWVPGTTCCNDVWEKAYSDFESETQEIKKFRRRLLKLGVLRWPRSSRIVDLFCGSGRNLQCLESFGFCDIHGVDLSPRLLTQYSGTAKLYVGDATELHFCSEWADIVLVQGGLHHLPKLPDDFEKCLSEVRRVLKPRGKFVIVEPWLTPMLSFVHFLCSQRLVTSMWPKLQALSSMIEEEKQTYFSWLNSSTQIIRALNSNFDTEQLRIRFGKLHYVGVKA
jgi:ubiquinone/menaquinone biosynthesis C-methylase UbiE